MRLRNVESIFDICQRSLTPEKAKKQHLKPRAHLTVLHLAWVTISVTRDGDAR